MNLYSAERNVLDRHRQLIADAELRARLLAGVRPRHAWRVWTAGRLRAIAERLDRSTPHERRVITLFRTE